MDNARLSFSRRATFTRQTTEVPRFSRLRFILAASPKNVLFMTYSSDARAWKIARGRFHLQTLYRPPAPPFRANYREILNRSKLDRLIIFSLFSNFFAHALAIVCIATEIRPACFWHTPQLLLSAIKTAIGNTVQPWSTTHWIIIKL